MVYVVTDELRIYKSLIKVIYLTDNVIDYLKELFFYQMKNTTLNFSKITEVAKLDQPQNSIASLKFISINQKEKVLISINNNFYLMSNLNLEI